jgi:hypothetical protein
MKDRADVVVSVPLWHSMLHQSAIRPAILTPQRQIRDANCHPTQFARRTVACVGALLRLRPSKLSRCDAENLTEMTREMALVGKAYGVCNLRQ